MNNNTNEILVGIDFGTTNSVISLFSSNKSIVLVDGMFKIIPSKIGKLNGKIYCGNYIPLNCKNVVHSFKTNIGNNNKYILEDSEYTSIELLIIFFNHLKDLIHKHIKTTNIIIKAVITVPSNFNDTQREIIKTCFTSININVIRIINEPSAAALAYGLYHSSNEEERILVIDTGGGTMDFTILEKTDLFFEVIHSEGLNDLGGNDFTRLIYNDILKINKLSVDSYDETKLWYQSQKIKEKLSYLDYYECSINNNDKYGITRNKFLNLTNNLINRINQTLQNIIEIYQNINYIILVGGSSRIPILKETIKKITNKEPWIHPNLESVVAEGAGLYSGIIEQKYNAFNDVILMDVVPLSLGVELADGTFSVIVPKNTPLPIKTSHRYTTDSPCDSLLKVKVYQGERKIANKNHLIHEFTFDKVSLGGVPIIEITFKIDLNSIINMSVIDRKSGYETNIIIKDIPKIENEQINVLIEQALKLSDCDNEELLINQNKYLIKTHIENSLINLQINDKITENDKNEIINKLNEIEEKLDSLNSFQLIETLKYLQDNFLVLGNAILENQDDDNHDSRENYDNSVEKLFYVDKKNELKNKIDLLLVKNPDWSEFLEPVLEELTYANTTIEYINSKLELLNELEESTKNNHDYKQEVHNLCLYLKNEIETGSIDLGEKNIILINLIDSTIQLVNDNLENVDWENQLKILNKKCEEIYNL